MFTLALIFGGVFIAALIVEWLLDRRDRKRRKNIAY